jgi:hypothetical protein
VSNVPVQTACETCTNFVHQHLEYPHGKIFTYTAEGLSMSSTEDSSSSANAAQHLAPPMPSKRKTTVRPQRGSSAIREMFPKARSVAFIPFWDYERSRWFAGCLCWSNDPYRMLSGSVDLAYFKIFSHSIMRELSRLDAVHLNQVSYECFSDVALLQLRRYH